MRYITVFLKSEIAGGICLFLAAFVALIICNSPLNAHYQHFLTAPISLSVWGASLNQPTLFWINDGLMVLFFLQIGLELKREFLEGELADVSQVLLPGIAAFGGMLIPAITYYLINYNHPEALRGWSVPVATDIAFSLGILSLFGKRVPAGLKFFLMSLAIFDDVGAILIIAVFHSSALSLLSLCVASLTLLVLLILNKSGVLRLSLYLIVGIVLWLSVLNSGVHATVAGVLLALMIPLPALRRLHQSLEPWVIFVILPLFAFANAGLSFHDLTPVVLAGTVVWGTVIGLFIGKQLGVLGFAFLTIKSGLSKLPNNTTWMQIYGVAILCGIGFTMSLFLGTLAFEESNPNYLIEVRFGVLMGSFFSSILGIIVLQRVLGKKMASKRGLG